MSFSRNVFKIKGTIKNYDWGSTTLIPNLLNLETTTNPVAEVWFGSHKKGPSIVESQSETNLVELINDYPEKMLGKYVLEKYGPRLPFLFKFLGIDKPLSVQVHPTLQQAKDGWNIENEIGTSHDSETRVYVDQFDKPEQLCAISEVWALCGFRSLEEITRLLEPIDLISKLKGQTPGDKFLEIFELNHDSRAQTLESVKSYAEKATDSVEWSWIRKLLELNQSDITVIAPLFMNVVHLKPNESIYLDAGTIHAYLSGLAAEVMGSSDNVVRAGLTSKHIAIDELKKILRKTASQPEILRVMESHNVWKIWPSRNAYFQIGIGQFMNSKEYLTGPAIVSLVAGEITLSFQDEIETLKKGDSAYICGEVKVSVSGTGFFYFSKVNTYENQ